MKVKSDNSYEVSRPQGWSLRTEKIDTGDYEISGNVATPHGMVEVSHYGYAGRGGKPPSGHTFLRWQNGSRVYSRQLVDGQYSRRYLVTLAARYAAEMSRLHA